MRVRKSGVSSMTKEQVRIANVMESTDPLRSAPASPSLFPHIRPGALAASRHPPRGERVKRHVCNTRGRMA